MTPRLKLRTVLPTLLAGLAVATGVGGPIAEKAEAHPDLATNLTITPDRGGFYAVKVSGHLKMSRAEAQRQIDNGLMITFSILGDDPIRPDFIDGPNPVAKTDMRASARGVEYQSTRMITGGRLNEDWGGDEIYGSVSASNFKPGLGIKRSSGTNRVHGSF